MSTISLSDVAHARSGDKGNHANIGVVAYTEVGFQFLKQDLTAERVGAYFQSLGPTKVVRYELPNIRALNFLLYDVLAGGASRSLRIDTQGKLLGTALMSLEFDEPPNVRLMHGRPGYTHDQMRADEREFLKEDKLPDEDDV
jgi:hypothetical protein